VFTRITVIGAIYLSIVCALPELLLLYFDGTMLLIVVLTMLELVPIAKARLPSAGTT
jgi:preprotein translocase subunit SecY